MKNKSPTKMDPVLEELYEVRHRISAEHGHNPKRLVRYLQQLDQKHRAQIQMFERQKKNPASLVVRETDAPYRGR